MKKYICIFAAFAAVLSCQKEAPVIPSSTETLSAPATLTIENLTNPLTRLGINTTDNCYEWTEGDQICVRQNTTTDESKQALTNAGDSKVKNALSATSSNRSSTFSGTISLPYKTSSWYIFYPYSAVDAPGAPGGTKGFNIILPSKQSGTFENFINDSDDKYSRLGECLMMTTDNFRVVVDTDLSELNEDNTMYSKVVFKSAQMNLMTPVIKLTIPEELKVKQITFKAYNIKEGTSTPLEICGKFTMTMRGRIVTRFPSDIYGTSDTKKKNYEEIIIRRNDSNDNKELIFGDVYITILPDLVKDTAMGTTSSANELYFKFQTTLNEADVNYKYVEVRQPITNTLAAGKVLDLGTVPTNLEFIAPNASSQASVNFSGTVPSTTPAE